MAFAEDVVKCETGIDECTVILKRALKEHGIDKELLDSELKDFGLFKKEDGNDGE